MEKLTLILYCEQHRHRQTPPYDYGSVKDSISFGLLKERFLSRHIAINKTQTAHVNEKFGFNF